MKTLTRSSNVGTAVANSNFDETMKANTGNSNQRKRKPMKRTSKLIRSVAPLAACALLLPTAAIAQTTSFTATGWVNAVLAPGIVAVNGLGQVLYRGGVHTARVEGSDPRVAGQVFIVTDGGYNADGTASIQGPAYLQVGTWDPAGTNFTPNGAMWNLNWRGVMQTDYSLQLSLAGYGVGGSIDGLRTELTLTRATASGPVDPTVPYLYAGTIKPPSISSNLFSDDFRTGITGWTPSPPPIGVASLSPTNQQLLLQADWTNAGGNLPQNTFFAFAPSGTWTPADGQTVACQADLVSVSQNSTNMAFLWLGDGTHFYFFSKSQKWVCLGKSWSGSSQAVFWLDNTVQLPATNVVLYLALTRDGPNLIITTRVLDKDNQDALVFERSFADTPGADASLTAAEFTALTGTTTWSVVPENYPPVLSGAARGAAVSQFTDGQQPPVEAVWDNFSLRHHDVPPLSIARAVQLTWPAPAGVNYSIESASTVQGPWLPVQDPEIPGIQSLTVPFSGPARFFRLIQAP